MERHDNKYSTTADMGSVNRNLTCLSHSMHLLLDSVIKTKNSKFKTTSIGQSIMQSTCSRSFLPPLQVGVSVTLEHKYGHRDVIDMIRELDYCFPYSEANKYRTNAATD